MPEYGYIRVSSNGVSEAEQYDAIMEFGVVPENIFIDMEGPEHFERPAFQALLDRLLSGDRLYIYSLDRLAFKCEEIPLAWGLLTETRGVQVSAIDTLRLRLGSEGSKGEVNSFLIKTLAAVHQSERDHTRQQGRARIAAARAKGVRVGSRPMERPPELYQELTSLWERGEITAKEAGRRLGVSHVTWLKWMKNESRVRVKKSAEAKPKPKPLPAGRPPKKLPDNFLAVTSAWEDKEISANRAAQMLGVTRSTFVRWVELWC